ncbi:putative PDDEXK endonuclease [Chitinolyticbacter meiyuanensis]|uniref:putative PDDEXK endonuclease n=1 Tax=Chitinolyticbacter meiyuanensis TaxID=682798 RepID=UPI0011E5BCB0|nr:hypothetical protein [Chitinolyticbacter meiyuanensis]
MSTMQRRKGAAAERELFGLLEEELGIAVKRNLTQTREKGCDTLDVAGWAIECKRQESLQLGSWWAQTLRQADTAKCRPILFYRQSRQPWRAVVRLHDVAPAIYEPDHGTTTMDLQAACQLIRSLAQVPLFQEA